MIKFIKASFSLAKNIKTTGALTETSLFVTKEITRNIIPTKSQIILEVGAGHGNVTKVILKKMHPKSTLYSFELNRDFCLTMQEKFNDPRLKIINDNAENFEKYLIEKEVDAIISTLPFTLFPKQLSLEILSKFKDKLNQDGQFSQVYYSLFFLKVVRLFFDQNKIKLVANFPPAFIIHSSKK